MSWNAGRIAALVAVPLAVFGAAAVPAQATLAQATLAQATSAQAASAQDASGLQSVTCQGRGVDPAAEARHRAEIFIKAPLHTVWGLHTDVESWTSWQKPAAPMTVKRLDHGPLRKGSRFQAKIEVPPGEVVITSSVQQLRHGKCVRWTGPADGPGYHIDGVHVWDFHPVRGGVLVRTEETHRGPQADPNSDMGLDTWLRDLKSTAETRAGKW